MFTCPGCGRLYLKPLKEDVCRSYCKEIRSRQQCAFVGADIKGPPHPEVLTRIKRYQGRVVRGIPLFAKGIEDMDEEMLNQIRKRHDNLRLLHPPANWGRVEHDRALLLAEVEWLREELAKETKVGQKLTSVVTELEKERDQLLELVKRTKPLAEEKETTDEPTRTDARLDDQGACEDQPAGVG